MTLAEFFMKNLLTISCLLLLVGCSHPTNNSSTVSQPKLAASEADADAMPTVITYQDGDNTIEERRVRGVTQSVKVIPKHGKPYYLVNADGDVNSLSNGRPQEKIPSWTLLSW